MTATIEHTETTRIVPITGDVLPAEPFDYGQMDAASAATVRALVPEIRKVYRLAISEVAEVGRHLNTAKNLLRHGLFGEWLKREFGLSERTAQNYMKFALLPEEIRNGADLSLSALYRLSPGTEPGDGEVTKAPKSGGGDALVKVARRLINPALDDANEDDLADAFSAGDVSKDDLDKIYRNALVVMGGATEASKRLKGEAGATLAGEQSESAAIAMAKRRHGRCSERMAASSSRERAKED